MSHSDKIGCNGFLLWTPHFKTDEFNFFLEFVVLFCSIFDFAVSQTIKGMYQIAQNMSKVHLCERCTRIPQDVKKRMVALRR